MRHQFAFIPSGDSLEFLLRGHPRTGGFLVSTISIPLDPETARAFERASVDEQRKLRLILSLRLRELTTAPLPPLQTILDAIGREAQEKGLTSEILDALLHAE